MQATELLSQSSERTRAPRRRVAKLNKPLPKPMWRKDLVWRSFAPRECANDANDADSAEASEVGIMRCLDDGALPTSAARASTLTAWYTALSRKEQRVSASENNGLELIRRTALQAQCFLYCALPNSTSRAVSVVSGLRWWASTSTPLMTAGRAAISSNQPRRCG